jgi:hypothetical protein
MKAFEEIASKHEKPEVIQRMLWKHLALSPKNPQTS